MENKKANDTSDRPDIDAPTKRGDDVTGKRTCHLGYPTGIVELGVFNLCWNKMERDQS